MIPDTPMHLIRTDGSAEQILIGKGQKLTLEYARDLIQGWIELVPIRGSRLYMLVDEDGWLKERPFNEAASQLARTRIAGDVIVVDADMILLD